MSARVRGRFVRKFLHWLSERPDEVFLQTPADQLKQASAAIRLSECETDTIVQYLATYLPLAAVLSWDRAKDVALAIESSASLIDFRTLCKWCPDKGVLSDVVLGALYIHILIEAAPARRNGSRTVCGVLYRYFKEHDMEIVDNEKIRQSIWSAYGMLKQSVINDIPDLARVVGGQDAAVCSAFRLGVKRVTIYFGMDEMEQGDDIWNRPAVKKCPRPEDEHASYEYKQGCLSSAGHDRASASQLWSLGKPAINDLDDAVKLRFLPTPI